MDDDLGQYLADKAALVDRQLDSLLPAEEEPPYLLHRAMRYSVMSPGKRIRPLLCLAANEAGGGRDQAAIKSACSLELVHAYSLIHDDLPSMDNDDLRRGRPTSHKVFGEGIAILAGDAILSLAFDAVAGDTLLSDCQCRRIVAELARASGSRGLVGGQQADLSSQGKQVSPEMIRFIHTRKTGALIAASVVCGAITAEAGADRFAALTDYGAAVGLAFQIKDDILDVNGDPAKLGKATGQDEKASKATYPAVLGLEQSREIAQDLLIQALQALKPFGPEADRLRQIARFIVERNT